MTEGQSDNAHEIGGYRFASTVTAIPIATLYSLVSQRRIPHIRLSRRMVRFRRADLERWLADRAVPVGGAAQ